MGGSSFRFLYYTFIWLLFLPGLGWAQQSETALLNQLKTASHDSTKIRIYNDLARKYWHKNAEKLKKYTLSALNLTDTTQKNRLLGRTYSNAHQYYKVIGAYPKAIEYSKKALAVFQHVKYSKGLAGVYNNLGIIYEDQGEYTQAIEYHFKSLRLAEKLKDQASISASLNNIAAIYEAIEQYDKALEYFKKALTIDQKRNNIEDISISQVNISQIYFFQKKYDHAKTYAHRSIANAKKAQSPLVESAGLKFLAMIQSIRNDTVNATANFEKSYSIIKKLSYTVEQADLLAQMAKYYLKLNKLNKAEGYGTFALNKALKIGAKKEAKDVYQVLSEVYERQGKLAKALDFHKKYAIYKDSLLQLQAKNKLIQHELEYTYDKKEQQIKTESNEQLNQQNIYLYAISFGLLVVSLFSFFLFRGSRKQNNLNRELKAQQEELTSANQHLQQKQTEIETNNQELKFLNHRLKSGESVITKAYGQLRTRNKQIKNNIRAALTIQQAMLPPVALIRQLLPEHFIIYLPKDIVSGDFYWINEVGDKTVLIFADCTGHGVQGAFMSLIGHNLLDKIILQQGDTDPASILTQLNQQVLMALHRQDARSIDGMDIGIVMLENISENERMITYAGAKRPLYYISADDPQQICWIEGVRKSIGGPQKNNKSFTNEVITIPTGSMLYMGTDGLTDQHDYQRQKIGTLRLRKILTELYPLPLTEQETSLFALVQRHMLNTEQRDDIFWMGVKV